MRDIRDNRLLKRLGYVTEAHAYTGAPMTPLSRRYVSAIDDSGGAVYAIRKSGVPVLLVAWGALSHYQTKGHAWPDTLRNVRGGTYNVVYDIEVYKLAHIRKHAPELLDQQSGVALFNVADANRLLAKYDAQRAAKRATRKEGR